MQESRIAVVSSTAAATLRQIVMFIIDKVVEEDRNDRVETIPLTEISLPDNSKVELGPSAVDAYSVVEDLCLLANTEKPHFLRLGSLPKTFALELIESVLTNYHDLFRKVTFVSSLHTCLLKILFPSTRNYLFYYDTIFARFCSSFSPTSQSFRSY